MKTALDIYPSVFRYCYKLTRNMEDAKDLCQTAYQLYYEYGYRDTFPLFNIAKTRHINNQTSVKGKAIHYTEAFIAAVTYDLDLYDAEYYRKRLNQLGVKGEAVRLFTEGYSYKEIAERQHVPVDTIKTRIHVAKKQLGAV